MSYIKTRFSWWWKGTFLNVALAVFFWRTFFFGSRSLKSKPQQHTMKLTMIRLLIAFDRLLEIERIDPPSPPRSSIPNSQETVSRLAAAMTIRLSA